jgi:hypothetical protein
MWHMLITSQTAHTSGVRIIDRFRNIAHERNR